MTLTDAGPILALIDRNEAMHKACQLVLPRLAKPMVTPSPCFTEAMYLLGRELGYPGQQALWNLRRSGALTVRPVSEAELDRMEELMRRYRDTPMDLADTSLVAAAETLNLSRIFTLDRHFCAYRLASGSALEVVP